MAKVAGQGGILEGANPSRYDPKNPVIIFIIQAAIIIIFCRVLHFPLSKMRQPRVIAEVIGGILLGPSVFGRIPGFTEHIFPTASMPTLSMAANIGLILFLFLVGLEVDLRLLLSNWKIALSVGLAGMALPFGLGCGIAYGLYHQFREEPGLTKISFGTYMLFIGVAMAITAFPVLCRILTELKLLQSQVGVVVLSAGVGNDVVGWILLALSVALVNAGSGITALYVLLTAVAYILFLVYAVRPAFMWILKRTNSIHNGPSQSIVALTVLMVLGSAFFTGIIGIHPIFGAFLIGLICPHDGGFAIKLTEKIEDLVTVFFLPLYFALSGLSTNIGLLDNGITWAYVVGVIAVAFLGKMIGGTLAARANKLVWRESFTIGVLMSCKGLVELIVLNIGLQAKILSQRTFTIFVVMALITTFATTPLTSFLFPPWYQTKLASWKRGEIDWDGRPLNREDSAGETSTESVEKHSTGEIRKLLIALGLDSLPTIFTFMDLLGGGKLEEKAAIVHPSLESKEASPHNAMTIYRPLKVHGLRMLGVTERMSSVMQEPEIDELSSEDPIIKAFHTFGQLHSVTVSGSVKLVPEDSYANVLTSSAMATHSDLILLAWTEVANPSPTLPASSSGYNDPSSAQYVESVLEHAPCSTAVFVNNGFGIQLTPRNPRRLPSMRSLRNLDSNTETSLPTVPALERSHHIFLPFFGGVDDYVALMLLLQLARNPIVTATVMRMPSSSSSKAGSIASRSQTITLSKSGTPTVTTATVPETSTERDAEFFHTARNSLPQERGSRVMFCEAESGRGLVELVNGEVGRNTKNAGDLVITGRRHGGSVQAPSHVLGDAAALLMKAGVKASFCVVQAGRGSAI